MATIDRSGIRRDGGSRATDEIEAPLRDRPALPAGCAPEIVGDAAAWLGASLDLAATLEVIADAARRALGAERATCYAYDVEAQVVSAVFTTESDPERRAFLERTAGLGPAVLPIWRLQLTQPDPLLAVEDVTCNPAVPASLAARLGSGAFLGVRLEHRSVRAEGAPALLGTLFCSYARPRRFSAGDLQSVRGLANLAALALANARLNADAVSGVARASAATETVRRQRDYHAALIGAMQDGLTVLSPEGVLIEVSERFCAMTGFSREELLGSRPPFPYWPDARLSRIRRAFKEIRAGGAREFDLLFRRRDGVRFPVVLNASPLRDEWGRIVGYLGTVKDVTERRRVEECLRRSEAEQAALRRVATSVATESDPRVTFALVAAEVAGLLGVEAGLVARFEGASAVPVGWWGAHQRQLRATFPLDGASALARVYRSGKPASVSSYARLGDDEVARVARDSSYQSDVAAPIQVDSRLWGAVLAATTRPEPLPADCEERLAQFAELVAVAIANAEARAELALQAATDPLTCLPNRRALEARLEEGVEQARRTGRQLSVLVLDLDRFKDVNDSQGHDVGDAVLRATARTLEAALRPGDLAGRLGGEEFLVLLPDTGSRAAWLVAERLRAATAAEAAKGAPTVTASLGVASFPTHARSAGELLRAADSAMYDAKALGRDRAVVFNPHEAAIRSEHTGQAQAGHEGYLGSVLALAAAVDARDPSTHQHSQTVARYAAAIATHLGLDGDRVEEIRIAGLLHDVGKVGVPDAVLHKAWPLTDEEWVEMRRHPEIGARILAHPELAAVRDWVLRHHERPDGRGYPDGLAGPEIPVEARILAVADAYEAMTADRPYRPRLTSSAARAELEACRGSQFDTEVVEAFLAFLDAEHRESPLNATEAKLPTGQPTSSDARSGPNNKE